MLYDCTTPHRIKLHLLRTPLHTSSLVTLHITALLYTSQDTAPYTTTQVYPYVQPNSFRAIHR